MSERDHLRDNESQADNLRAVILTALTTDADRSGRLDAVRLVYEATPETPLERDEDLVARIVGPALDADRTGKTPEGTEAEAAALAAELIAARPAEPCPALVKDLPRSLPEALIQYSPDVADGALLVAGTVTVISGAGGVGKSRLALQLAMTGAGAPPGAWVSTGLGLDVRGGPVLMAGYEDDPGVVRWRSETMASAGGVEHLRAGFDGDALYHLNMCGHPIFGPADDSRRLYNARPGKLPGWKVLWRPARELGARLVIVDPATCAYVGESNALAPVREFLQALATEAGEIGAGVLLVTHGNKASRSKDAPRDDPGRVGGSAAWVDGARGALTMAPTMRDKTNAKGKGKTDRERVSGRWDLVVAKANYGATGVCLELEELADSKKRPVAYRQATAVGLDAVEYRSHL